MALRLRRSRRATRLLLDATPVPLEDAHDPIDVTSGCEQAVTLNDPQDRINTRGVTGDELDMDAGRSAGLGNDLGLESILTNRHIDQPGSHEVMVPIGTWDRNPNRRGRRGLRQRALMTPEDDYPSDDRRGVRRPPGPVRLTGYGLGFDPPVGPMGSPKT